ERAAGGGAAARTEERPRQDGAAARLVGPAWHPQPDDVLVGADHPLLEHRGLAGADGPDEDGEPLAAVRLDGVQEPLAHETVAWRGGAGAAPLGPAPDPGHDGTPLDHAAATLWRHATVPSREDPRDCARSPHGGPSGTAVGRAQREFLGPVVERCGQPATV